MEYTVKYNQTILDVVLSQTGDIKQWENVLNDKNFTTWTPELSIGQVLTVPIVANPEVVKEINYISNYSYGLNSLISEFLDIIDTAVAGTFVLPIIIPTQEYYIAKEGETITDIILNNTGDLKNWETILNLNNFTSWTPTLKVGDKLILGNLVANDNVRAIFGSYPICNDPNIQDLDEQILNIFSTFADIVLFDGDLTEVQFDGNLETVLFD